MTKQIIFGSPEAKAIAAADRLLNVAVSGTSPIEHDWVVAHDTAFLLVATTKGIFTVETHNEHNGCYGGFSLCAKEVA